MTLSILEVCNSANFNRSANWNGSLNGNLSTVGTNGRASYYGTYDQTGNIDEILGELNGGYPVIRGGSFNTIYSTTSDFLSKAYSSVQSFDGKTNFRGFRIAKNISAIDNTNYVVVGNAGDAGDPSNSDLGRVNIEFQIKKYPVTNAEYVAFLNAVARTSINSVSLWVTNMGNASSGGGISRTLSNGGIYTYAIINNMENKPVNYIDWFSAVRYINWLHNGQPVGPPGPSTTETGPYTLINFVKAGLSKPSLNNRNTYWLPSEDEWYKAAYYSPNKNGNNVAGFWAYATQSDSLPDSVVVDINGNAINTARNPNVCISPTPTSSNTPTPSITPSITPTFTPTVSLSPSLTPSRTPTITPTLSVTPTKTPTPTRTVTKTITPTPSVTKTNTRTPTTTPTLTPTPSVTKSQTPTVTVTPTLTRTPTKSLCAPKKIGELIYQNNVYLDDEIKVLYKGYSFIGKLLPNVSTLYLDNTTPPSIFPNTIYLYGWGVDQSRDDINGEYSKLSSYPGMNNAENIYKHVSKHAFIYFSLVDNMWHHISNDEGWFNTGDRNRIPINGWIINNAIGQPLDFCYSCQIIFIPITPPPTRTATVTPTPSFTPTSTRTLTPTPTKTKDF